MAALFQVHLCFTFVIFASAIQAAKTDHTAWTASGILPNAFLSVVYKGNFRVSIYENAGNSSSCAHYYTPALILDPQSITTRLNTFTKRWEMTFSVLMWNEEYEEFVRSVIRSETEKSMSAGSVRVLPIKGIRIHTQGPSFTDYEVVDSWTPYSNQPGTFKFRMVCVNAENCSDLAKNLRNSPEDFVHDMVVSYSLASHTSNRRSIPVKTEHLQAGNLFSTVNQRFPDKTEVFLQAEDVSRMVQEAASNAIAEKLVEDEFVSQEESSKVSSSLERMLHIRTISTEAFDDKMWDNVHWSEGATRPDQITSRLNSLYDNVDDLEKLQIRSQLSRTTREVSRCFPARSGVGSSTGLKMLLPMAGDSGPSSSASDGVDQQEFHDFASGTDLDMYRVLLNEARNKCHWKVSKFVPKPMTLKGVNLTALRESSPITTAQVKVTRSSADLQSRINLLSPQKLKVTPPLTAATTTMTTSALPSVSCTAAPGEKVRPSHNGTELNCPGFRYVLFNETRTYPEASRLCRASGGSIAIFRNETGFNCVKNKAPKLALNRHIWIGLMSLGSNSSSVQPKFIWTDGEPFSAGQFSPWKTGGEPSNGSDEQCVVAACNYAYAWWDVPCDLKTTVPVCEIP